MRFKYRYYYMSYYTEVTYVLTMTAINKAKPRDKKYTMSDIRGLHIEIMPTGRKFWRMRYTKPDGKKSWATIGEFPAVSLDEAREQVQDLQQRLKDGLPLVDEPDDRPDALFADAAAAWLEYNDGRSITEARKREARSEMARYVIPALGHLRMREITPPDILALLQKISATGKHSIVVTVKGMISQVFKYAALRGLVEYDPVAMLRGAISIPSGKHRRTITNTAEIGEFLRAVNAYPNTRIRLAALFLIYSFCRPGEMRNAEWSEVDLEKREWRIPAEKMKKRRPHIVPLSSQLVSILDAARERIGGTRYIFINTDIRGKGERPMQKCTIAPLLIQTKYIDRISPHGVRGMASTILNENGFNSDWIERQLAHIEMNASRATYNYADYLDDRRRMVQWYGNYLDELRGEPMDLS